MGKPITERPIHVYTCLSDPERKCVAIIDGLPMIFKGDSPMRAKRAADEWRQKAVRDDKLLTKVKKEELLGGRSQ